MMFKRIIASLLAAAAILCISVSAADISPSLQILRAETQLEKCGIANMPIQFTEEDFTDTFGEEIEYITISTIPEKSVGKLTLAGLAVIEGQTITRSNIKHLKFIPNENVTCKTSFSYTVCADGWEQTQLEYTLNVLPNVNYAPIAKTTEMKTRRNVTVYKTLNAYDPEGDDITMTVTQYPSNGTASYTPSSNTVFYTPNEDYSGNDSFTFYLTDRFGNKSNEATVDITVETADSLCFGDMNGKSSHYAAIYMAENSIMTYSLNAGEYYFSPDDAVSRIDFVVMLLCAAGLNGDQTASKDTSFIDDTGLSDGRKQYLEKALKTGVVSIGDGYFRPHETITVAEASSMISSLMELEGAELAEITGNRTAAETLTKEATAEILYNIIMHLE